ncbi:MAG: hypothetical protein CME65_03005 [Halobacteriovoraceae bacterium]|nr:hypothetical protein [Halobacteriovoraceae bacterium]
MKTLFLLFVLVSCDQLASRGDLEFETQAPLMVETEVSFTELKEKVLAPNRCLNCHGFLANEEEVLERVEPGRPELSILYILLESGNMPLGGPKVSDEDLAFLKVYIEQLDSLDE